MAEILYGAPVADAIDGRTATAAAHLADAGTQPALAIVRVGEEHDQVSYQKGATKRCEKVGIDVRVELLAADASQEELAAVIASLNADAGVHGILMLAPLPAHLDADAARNAIAPEKDVDVASDASLQGVFCLPERTFSPCTPQACIEVLDHYGIDIEGKRVVVIGRSLVVGRPVSMLLLERNATVTICHSRTVDLPCIAREADILVAAIGRAGFVGAEFVRPGQTVIDVGINWDEEAQRLCGDVDFASVEPIVAAITPVPRGVGSVTTSVLAAHVVAAAEKAARG